MRIKLVADVPMTATYQDALCPQNNLCSAAMLSPSSPKLIRPAVQINKVMGQAAKCAARCAVLCSASCVLLATVRTHPTQLPLQHAAVPSKSQKAD